MKPMSLARQFLHSLPCNFCRCFLQYWNHPSQVLRMTTQSWSPLEFLDTRNTTLQYAVLILNRPIIVPRADMFSLWNRACVRITVDGGTNRWYEYAKSEEDCALPDMIIGDMDSATVEVLNYYQERDVNIIRTPDQNETDFTKALRKTASYARNRQLKLDAVIAVVQTSGRLDQIIGIVNTLHKADSILDGLPVFIFSGTSLTWLLAPGKHYIDLRKYKHLLGKWCSLMPLGKPAHHVTTTGLKWNLVDRVMEFGGMVSTSNAYGSELEITVQTDSSLVWCMSVGEDIDDT